MYPIFHFSSTFLSMLYVKYFKGIKRGMGNNLGDISNTVRSIGCSAKPSFVPRSLLYAYGSSRIQDAGRDGDGFIPVPHE